MALYSKVINLISRPPQSRTTIECQELVDWLKGKSRLFANVKYGKKRRLLAAFFVCLFVCLQL